MLAALAAAAASCSRRPDDPSLAQSAVAFRRNSAAMLLREVGYARPTSVEEALGLLGESAGSRPLAGGQTLLNVMKARIASPDALIDLNGIDELKGIELGADGSLEIGAMTTVHRRSSRAPRPRARPILGEVCAQIADVQVRNRGTIGGNLCANDPTNHLPPLAGRARRADDDRRPRRRADGRRGGLLPRRLHDRGRAGRAADQDHDPAGPAATASPRSRSAATGRASSAPPRRSTAVRASRSAASPRCRIARPTSRAGWARPEPRGRPGCGTRTRGHPRPARRRARVERLPPPRRRGRRRRARSSRRRTER